MGLSHRDVLVLFPLSSEAVILGGVDLQERTISLGRSDVAGTNLQIIAHAERQIYARECS